MPQTKTIRRRARLDDVSKNGDFKDDVRVYTTSKLFPSDVELDVKRKTRSFQNVGAIQGD